MTNYSYEHVLGLCLILLTLYILLQKVFTSRRDKEIKETHSISTSLPGSSKNITLVDMYDNENTEHTIFVYEIKNGNSTERIMVVESIEGDVSTVKLN